MIALLEAKRAGLFARIHWLPNIVAGLVVGVVALPLAMAFAIASGLTPQAGIYCAIITGFLISALGGSRFQIGGPTGAFVVVVAGIVSGQAARHRRAGGCAAAGGAAQAAQHDRGGRHRARCDRGTGRRPAKERADAGDLRRAGAAGRGHAQGGIS